MEKHEPMLQFFKFDHLPEKMQEISKPFYILATDMVSIIPENTERTKMLNKLLEAKDCAVRSTIFK